MKAVLARDLNTNLEDAGLATDTMRSVVAFLNNNSIGLCVVAHPILPLLLVLGRTHPMR
jgi:hypothetical protein